MKKVLLICLFFGSFLLSNAQTNTWIGGASGSWSSTSSWSLGVLPTTGHTVVFDGNNIDNLNTVGSVTVTLVPAADITALQLTNNANVTFSSASPGSSIPILTCIRNLNSNIFSLTAVSTPFLSGFQVGDFIMSNVNTSNLSQITSIINGTSVTTAETYSYPTGTSLIKAATLRISGTNGLLVPFGSKLSINAAVNISLLTGATGQVDGSIFFTPTTGTNIRLVAADNGALVFKSGSRFVLGQFASGTCFGANATSVRGKVVFQSGSKYYHASQSVAGMGSATQYGTPIGGYSPFATTEFQDGSTVVFCTGTSFTLSTSGTQNAFFGVNSVGRYFSNVEIAASDNTLGAGASGNATTVGFTSIIRVGDVLVNTGQTITSSQGGSNGWPISGNYTNNGTFTGVTNTNSLRVLFAGNTPQTVSGTAGLTTNPTTNSFLGISVCDKSNVTFSSSFNVNPNAASISQIYGRLNIGSNTITNSNASFAHAIRPNTTASVAGRTGTITPGSYLITALTGTNAVTTGQSISAGSDIANNNIINFFGSTTLASGTVTSPNVLARYTAVSVAVAANLTNVVAGMSINGYTGIPDGTFVSNVNSTLFSAAYTSIAGNVITTASFGGTAPTTGSIVTGTNIAPGTTVIASTTTSVTLSQPTTGTPSGTISVLPTIVLSQPATANASTNITVTPTIALSHAVSSSAVGGTGIALTIGNGIGTIATSNTSGLDGNFTSTNNSITQAAANFEFNAATTTPFPTAWSATVTANNVTTNADITLNKALTVNGALAVNSGIFNPGTNALILGASASGTFGPSATLSITGTGGTVDFAARPVIFQSSATSTARLGTITGVLSNATNVTVERYIPLGKRAYRLLTPMVTTSSSIRANWQNGGTLVNNLGTHITGSTTGASGFDQTTSGIVSLFGYDNIGIAWPSITNTNINTLTAGTGYRLLIRGDRNVNLAAASQDNMNDYTVLRTTGTVVNGTGAAPADAVSGGVLPSLNTTIGNYSLVGNPFISPIDWHTVTRSGLEDTYYVWDPNMGTSLQRGRYVSYSIASGFNNLGNAGTSNVGRYIQPGQAFFVRATTGSPSISIKEADKASTFASVFRTQNSFSNLTIALFEPNEVASGSPIDAATVLLSSNFAQGIGVGDVEKLFAPGENISFKEAATSLMINARPLVNNDTMHLHLTNAISTGKDYAFKVAAADFGAAEQAFLVDGYLQTIQPLNLNGSTVINFSTINGNSTSYAANRFSIVFKTSGALPVSITNLKAYQKNTGINVEWNVVNEINMNKYEVEKSADGINFNKAGTVAAIGSSSYNWFDASPVNGNNFYRIKMMDKNGATKNTQVVNVKIGGGKNIFSVVANPVKNKTVVIQLENVEKGSYSIALFNNAGQQLVNRAIVHNGGSATETISLGNTAAGTYQLSIVGINGTRFTKTLLVD